MNVLRNYRERVILLGMILLFPITAYSQEGDIQDMSIGIDQLYGVALLRPGLTIVAHECGVMRTEDGGANWVIRNFSDCCGVIDMRFRNNIGIVADECDLWRTLDSGKTWSRVYDGDGVDGLGEGITFDRVWFVDSKIIVAVGRVGAALRSTDKGATWNKVEGVHGFALTGVDFYDGLQGIIVTNAGNDLVNRSFDGGATWKATPCVFQEYEGFYNSPDLTGVAYVDKDICVAVSTEGSIFRSTDNGINWEYCWRDPCRNSLADVTFFDNRHGVAVGDGGIILSTINGGITWNRDSEDPRFNLRRVEFLSRNEIIAVGDRGGILRKGIDW